MKSVLISMLTRNFIWKSFLSSRVQCSMAKEDGWWSLQTQLILSLILKTKRNEKQENALIRFVFRTYNLLFRYFYTLLAMSWGWQIFVKYKERRCHKNDYGNDQTKEKRKRKESRKTNHGLDKWYAPRKAQTPFEHTFACWQNQGDLCTG